MNETIQILEELKEEISKLAVEAGANEAVLHKVTNVVTSALDNVISRHKEG